jgi:hypothetical protein
MSAQTNGAAPAAVADLMRPSSTTVGQQDHVAAAAYLMTHAGTTGLRLQDCSGAEVGVAS